MHDPYGFLKRHDPYGFLKRHDPTLVPLAQSAVKLIDITDSTKLKKSSQLVITIESVTDSIGF
jgi:hypothetical protein